MRENLKEKMRKMRMFGMLRAFNTSLENKSMEDLTNDEMLTLLLDSEWDDRHNRTIERGLRNARFRYKATIEQLDFNPSRGLKSSCSIVAL